MTTLREQVELIVVASWQSDTPADGLAHVRALISEDAVLVTEEELATALWSHPYKPLKYEVEEMQARAVSILARLTPSPQPTEIE